MTDIKKATELVNEIEKYKVIREGITIDANTSIYGFSTKHANSSYPKHIKVTDPTLTSILYLAYGNMIDYCTAKINDAQEELSNL